MVFWKVAALGVFLLQTYATAMIGLTRVGIKAYVGPRDSISDPSVLQARAGRALANMRENMIVFLPLALLVVILQPQMSAANLSTALLGAELFIFSRLPYALAYVWGVPWVRSGIFMIGWVGMGMMAFALI